MKPLIEPFRQGQLDGLCGVYAIVNAVRLAAQDHPLRLTRSDCEQLFYAILSDLECGTGGILHAVMNGMRPKRFHSATKSAVRHMRDEHDIEISIKRLFGKDREPAIGDVINKVTQITRLGQPVIADFSGRLNHWSVVRGTTLKSLLLFDSAEHRYVRIDQCRVGSEEVVNERWHTIAPRSIYRLNLSVRSETVSLSSAPVPIER
jgi:hypothetical protein